MSTNQTPIQQGSVRVALGAALRREWRAANALGYAPAPTLDASDEKHIDISLSVGDDDPDPPHIVLRDVSEIATGSQGYAAIKATGAGPIQDVRGRRDVNIFVGEQGDLPGKEQAQLAAKRIGGEVRSIVHDNANGLMDPATGTLLATDLACSPPRVVPDPDLPEQEWRALCEVTFTRQFDPPKRE